jgi:hypothetical protein
MQGLIEFLKKSGYNVMYINICGAGGGSRINLSCFCTFLVIFYVLLIQMEIIGGGAQDDGLALCVTLPHFMLK